MKIALHIAIALSVCMGLSGVASAGIIEPTEYYSFADSPFNGMSFDYFHLEDFEDGALNTPGVTGSGLPTPGVFSPILGYVDSVDGDDGNIDGSGSAGSSYGVSGTITTISFTFDAEELENLPTHVAVVYTDGFDYYNQGAGNYFEAYDSEGNMIGTYGPYYFFDSYQVQGSTSEDRFIGFVYEGGISKIVASNNAGGGLELDHLQYGYASADVPEPGLMALMALGSLAALRRKRRS